MKRSALVVLAVCLLAVGCDDDNPASPTNTPQVFTADLRPANEVPPVGNAEQTGRGAVQTTLTVTRGADGAITAATATMHFQLSEFPNGVTVIGAHIHTGVAGVNGPVVVNTGLTTAMPLQFVNGVATFTIRDVTVTPATAQSIIDNPAAFYFNVHSPLNPGGFARGQLRRTL